MACWIPMPIEASKAPSHSMPTPIIVTATLKLMPITIDSANSFQLVAMMPQEWFLLSR